MFWIGVTAWFKDWTDVWGYKRVEKSLFCSNINFEQNAWLNHDSVAAANPECEYAVLKVPTVPGANKTVWNSKWNEKADDERKSSK